MKKLILSFMLIAIVIPTITAQTASDYYKKAKKAFDKYEQTENSDLLEEALKNIKEAVHKVDDLDEKKANRTWIKAGEIYNEIAHRDYKMFLVDNHHQPVHPQAATQAFEAFQKSIETADKKWDKSKALDELLKTATFISNAGIAAYNTKSYEKAYTDFSTVIAIKEFLTGQKHASILNEKGAYDNHLFRTALAAQKAGHSDKAGAYFEILKSKKYDNPAVYTGLAEIYTAEDKGTKALNTIKDGQTLFPDNESLMIAEINYYLKKDQLSILLEKLEAAAEKKPENVSILSSLGHVYDRMQRVEAEKGNFTLSKNYFDQSMAYFTRALDIDGMYAPALYNIGALYYNNAAVVTQELQSLEADQSATGIRAFSAKKSEMASLLDKALPYFQRAEAVNPNDLATLDALKEIYTRKNDDAMVNEFSGRLEKVQAGESIENGYFDN